MNTSKTVGQIMRFNYLGDQITRNRNLTKEVKANCIKASQISGKLCGKTSIYPQKAK